jgi:hypothetical protein
MPRDLSFLKNTKDRVEMPLAVTGECSGNAVLLQKFTTLLFSEPSEYRRFGGNLNKLIGASSDAKSVTSAVRLAATEVYLVLKEETMLGRNPQGPAGSLKELGDIKVEKTADGFTAEIELITEAGPVQLGVPLPIIER